MSPSSFSAKNIGSIILEEACKTEDVLIGPEDSGVKKRVIATGTLQKAETQNRNKRCYRRADLKRELEGPRVQELIHKAKQFKGEAGHPLSDSLIRQQTILPALCSVKYLKVWMEGDLVKANFKGTNNDLGEAFDADLRDGEKPAFSLRALGNLIQENGKSYVDHLKIITYDVVIFPSHPEAYTDKIISESGSLVTPDRRPTHMSRLTDKILTESAIDYEDATGRTLHRSDQIKMINNINEHGRVICLTGSDAYAALNKLQRESASIGSILETFEGIANDVRVTHGHVKLTTVFGESLYIPLDKHVDNLISDYVYSM